MRCISIILAFTICGLLNGTMHCAAQETEPKSRIKTEQATEAEPESQSEAKSGTGPGSKGETKIEVMTGSGPETQTVNGQKTARLTFEKMNHDFGTMKYGGKPRTYDFKFTNTGTAPLVIIRTEVSCRCLTVKYPKRPVEPGQSGVISATYSPDTYVGEFNNTIYVFSNSADRRLLLLVEGETLK